MLESELKNEKLRMQIRDAVSDLCKAENYEGAHCVLYLAWKEGTMSKEDCRNVCEVEGITYKFEDYIE